MYMSFMQNDLTVAGINTAYVVCRICKESSTPLWHGSPTFLVSRNGMSMTRLPAANAQIFPQTPTNVGPPAFKKVCA